MSLDKTDPAINNSVKSVCPYCGVGCGVILDVMNGKVTGVKGDPGHPANRGKLCVKGSSLHKTIHKKDRMRHPLIRKSRSSSFINTDWDNALDTIHRKFGSILEQYGPESLAFHVSGQLLTEDYYTVNKLAKGFLKVNNLDSNSRLCMSSAVMGYRRAFGVDAPPCTYKDIEHTDCVFIAGANMDYCHPVVFMKLMEEKEKKGDALRIIVADPRYTSTAGAADIYLPLKPGTDVALLNSIAHVLIKEDLVDTDYINDFSEGYEELTRVTEVYSPEKVSGICGISVESIYETARTIGNARAFMSFWAMGLNQSSHGTDKNNALINISIITGNIGKPGAGPFSLTGQANAMGGRESGGLANIIPGHRYMSDEEHRKEVAGVWSCGELSGTKGLTAVEVFDGLSKGTIKGIWIICTNPVVSMPNAIKVEKALKKAEFVVVQDIFHPTDTSVYADLLLPAAGFGEKEGTMTNQERGISYISKAVDPPGSAKPDWQIFTEFACKSGFGKYFSYKKAEDVFNEYKRLTVGTDMDISGVTYERLKNTGPVQWPCYDLTHPGTDRLYTDGKFHTDTGRARLLSLEYEHQEEMTDEEYPLVLTTGRIRDQWHTMTKTGKVAGLMKSDPEPRLDISPEDAEKIGIETGQLVVVESRRGEVTVKCEVTDRITRGTVFMSFHWGRLMADEGRANSMTIEAIDPVSQQPEFKACAVRVKKKVFDEPLRLVIVGSSETSGLMSEMIKYINPNIDIINVVSRRRSEGAKSDIKRIDTFDRVIEFENGDSLSYDRLVLNPENMAFVPPVKGIFSKGVSVVNGFDQAKRIIAKKHNIGRSVVIGSSPYTFELAGLLKIRGAEKVTLISPFNILLDKYLDSTGSQFLYDHLKEKGINIILGAEIEEIETDDERSRIHISGDICIEADSVYVQSVEKPDLDLALETGLLVNKGIVVGEKLETNIENIYAIGHVAEMKGVITQDPELLKKQAETLSRIISGDPTARYRETVDSNRFNILGIDIFSFGEFDSDDEKSNVMSFLDKARTTYKKIVIRDNVVVGGLYIGDTTGSGQVLEFARKHTDISKYRKNLLSGKLTGQTPESRIICSCMSVTENEIKSAIDKGLDEIEDLKNCLRVAVTCGSCLQEVRQIVKARTINE